MISAGECGQSNSVRRGHITEYTVDGLGRVTGVKDPPDFTVVTDYDNTGHPVRVTDKRNITTVTTYDDLYRPVSAIRAGVTLWTRGYDRTGNRTSFTDAENHTKTYTYSTFFSKEASTAP